MIFFFVFKLLEYVLMLVVICSCTNRTSESNNKFYVTAADDRKYTNIYDVVRFIKIEFLNSTLQVKNGIIFCISDKDLNIIDPDKILFEEGSMNFSYDELGFIYKPKVLYVDSSYIVFCHDNKITIYDIKNNSVSSRLFDGELLDCVRIGDQLLISKGFNDNYYSREIQKYSLIDHSFSVLSLPEDFSNKLSESSFSDAAAVASNEGSYFLLKQEKDDIKIKKCIHLDEVVPQNTKFLYNSVVASDIVCFCYGDVLHCLNKNGIVNTIEVAEFNTNKAKVLLHDEMVYVLLNNSLLPMNYSTDCFSFKENVLDVVGCGDNLIVVCDRKIILTNIDHLKQKKYYANINTEGCRFHIGEKFIVVYGNKIAKIYSINSGKLIKTLEQSKIIKDCVTTENYCLISVVDSVQGFEIKEIQ